MKKHWIGRVVKVAAIVVIAIALIGFVVMQLWNALLPGLFAWPTIGYLQAVGLLILSRILFGGFRGSHRSASGWRWRRRMLERWEKMTPEEREKFRQGMRRQP